MQQHTFDDLRVHGWAIRELDSTGSTNADLAAWIRDGVEAPAAVVAWHQSAGRGRLDRTWTAPAGTAAAISILVDLGGIAADRVPLLGLAAGLGVREAARRLGVEAELKWPNDVLVGGLKLCGILAERVADQAVLGIGINLLQNREQLLDTATSLAVEGSPVDPRGFVADLIATVEGQLQRWREGDPGLLPDYRRACASIGIRVQVQLPGGSAVEGVGADVDDQGRLVVRSGSSERAFAVGDVVHLRRA